MFFKSWGSWLYSLPGPYSLFLVGIHTVSIRCEAFLITVWKKLKNESFLSILILVRPLHLLALTSPKQKVLPLCHSLWSKMFIVLVVKKFWKHPWKRWLNLSSHWEDWRKYYLDNTELWGVLEVMHNIGMESYDACLLSASLHGNHKTETSHV